jgi:8-oxo-dGTP diphosphatase
MSHSITLQVGVKAIISNKEGNILLLNRSEEKYGKTDGHWDIPGGRIDPGETLINNLKREVLEETGLAITESATLLCAQDILLLDKEKHVVRLTYRVNDLVDGQVNLDETENTEFRWVPMGEAKKLNDLDKYLKEVLDMM